tara:strand:- start:132 stop:260 length:129 start_codon:yes stop_codon:yes gene_type:complete
MKLDHSDTVLENAKSAIGPLDKADESKSEAAQPPAKGEEIAK